MSLYNPNEFLLQINNYERKILPNSKALEKEYMEIEKLSISSSTSHSPNTIVKTQELIHRYTIHNHTIHKKHDKLTKIIRHVFCDPPPKSYFHQTETSIHYKKLLQLKTSTDHINSNVLKFKQLCLSAAKNKEHININW